MFREKLHRCRLFELDNPRQQRIVQTITLIDRSENFRDVINLNCRYARGRSQGISGSATEFASVAST
jgi:hypothetical protein